MSDFSKDDGNTTDSWWDKHPLGEGLNFDSESALQSPMGSATNMTQKTISATDRLKQAHEEAMNLFGGRGGLSLPGSSDVKVKYDAHGRPFTTVDMGAHGGPDDRSSPMGSATNMTQKTNSATDGLKQAHEEAMNFFGGRGGLSLPGSSDVKVKYDAHGRPFTTVDMGAHGGPDDRSSPNETMYFGVSQDWKNTNNARPSTLAAPWVNKGAKKGFDYNTKDPAFGSYA